MSPGYCCMYFCFVTFGLYIDTEKNACSVAEGNEPLNDLTSLYVSNCCIDVMILIYRKYPTAVLVSFRKSKLWHRYQSKFLQLF